MAAPGPALSKGDEETLRMKAIALELVGSEASTVGHKVGWNPIPKADNLPVQQAWGDLVRAISECFAFEPSDEFVERYVLSRIKGSDTGASWIKVVPGVGTLLGGIFSGINAREATKAFGRAYVDALVVCRTRDGMVTEAGLEQVPAARPT